ncbi:MAG TPA: LuxR C-terminal-related transcriptional regulator, partial [Solirubrobacteraceae bacterium]|nr:LuxR C-terminal-related transcriptional regulator [Solirubrobacteraceae bacterium]
LRRIRDGDRHMALRQVEQTTVAAVSSLAAGPSRTVRVLSAQQLLVELHSHWHEIQQDLLAQQMRMMGGVREALHRLRGAETMPQIIDRAAVEICRSCGVDRCVLMSMKEGRLIAESVHFGQDPDGQEKWTGYALAHPPKIDPRDPEIELLRRHGPILVSNNATSRGVGDISRAAQSTGYVGAPVMVHGSVIGTLFADRTFTAETVDTVARDVVGVFAEGLSYALERTLLLGRMRHQIGKIREVMAEADTTLDEMFDAGMSMRHDEVTGDIDIVGRGPVMPFDNAYRMMGLLTRREIEVIDLMARGASNGDIANELVISEGTVKSHVKHILRKTRAANRTQAVSCYLRLQSLSQN